MTESVSPAVMAHPEAAPLFDGSWKNMLMACSQGQDELLHIVLDLKYDLERTTSHTLIRSVSGRLKSLESIQAKLKRLGFTPDVSNAWLHLHDIAGIRLICSYIQDIYAITDALQSHPRLQVLEIKDYIAHPKPSGYRSVHVIAALQTGGLEHKCEIQLRTAAMDSWAALEHQLRYKQGQQMDPGISRSLTECSHMLFETDCRMQNIFTALQQESEVQ